MAFEELRGLIQGGTQLLPSTLEKAGWSNVDVVTSETTKVNCWVKKDTKEERQVFVIFAEGDSGNYFVRIGGEREFTFAFSSRSVEALCIFLLLQYPFIEFESPSDILKMLGV